MKINFDEAPERRSNILDFGKHLVRISESKQGVTKSGASCLEITFAGATGAELTRRFVTAPTSLWVIANLFEAIGLKTTGEVEVSPLALVGKSLYITVVEQTRNGRTFHDVEPEFSPAPVGVKVEDADELPF